ncbi:MAG: ribbon-helix-helix protein, CopG family [Candidatus Aminicenantes bacterium]|nr:ribbon-helix-helix protein, CopG family [Candidatus Aminicenantes bacterium]
MSKTVKFTVSMSSAEFKDLESMRRKKGVTRSQFIRDAVRTWKEEPLLPLEIREETGVYKKATPMDIVDLEERRKRAMAAAGRFRSGISDLSSNHDKHLEAVYAETCPCKKKRKKVRRNP